MDEVRLFISWAWFGLLNFWPVWLAAVAALVWKNRYEAVSDDTAPDDDFDYIVE